MDETVRQAILELLSTQKVTYSITCNVCGTTGDYGDLRLTSRWTICKLEGKILGLKCPTCKSKSRGEEVG